VIAIVGDAGVGKSRLAFEFARRCRGEGIAVFEAHCPAHGRTLPLFAASELLRSYFGVERTDTAAETRRRVAQRLGALGSGFDPALPLLFDALGVPDPKRPLGPLSSKALRGRWSEFLRRWVQSASRDDPIVLVLDDLHWIDPESDQLIADLVEALGWTRTLLLANFRPEYHAPWLQGSYCRALALGPLAADARRDLLGSLLGDDPSIGALARSIDARAAGNPLFMEEIVRAAEGSGRIQGRRGAYRLAHAGGELEIPESVQSVLAGRIDRLPEREKRLLQTAAVIGSRFEPALLERVSGLPDREVQAALGLLVRLELLVLAGADHAFAHPLTHEVAYQSQLEASRQGTHLKVARALEELHHDRLGEHAARIAQHWDAGGVAHEAALWRRRAALRVSSIQVRRRRTPQE
jgi:adenylate cyclase